jgi:hypothetical protein
LVKDFATGKSPLPGHAFGTAAIPDKNIKRSKLTTLFVYLLIGFSQQGFWKDDPSLGIFGKTVNLF